MIKTRGGGFTRHMGKSGVRPAPVVVPTDPFWANVNLLAINNNGANGTTTFTDQSAIGATLTTSGNAAWSNGTAPTGLTTSALLDGTGDYISAPTGANYRFAGDFTVEGFMYRSGAGGAVQVFYDCRASTASATGFAIYLSSGVLVVFSNGLDQINGGAYSTTTWRHVALCRSGTSIRLFVNGTQVGATWTSSANFSDGLCRLGAIAADGLSPLLGSMASWRVTQAARYTGAFTPPTLPMPTA